MNFMKSRTISLAILTAVFLVGLSFCVPAKNTSLGVSVAEASGAEAAAPKKEALPIIVGAPAAAYVPWKALFAALAIIGTALCTALAQMKIGGAGAGAIAERPETAAMFIVLVAIPETIVILGFVVAAMLIMF